MTLKLVKNPTLELVDIIDFVKDEFTDTDAELDSKEKCVTVTFIDWVNSNDTTIKIYLRGNGEDSEKQGCHVTSDSWEEIQQGLRNAITSCFKDGFETIYIHDEAA